MGLTGSPGKPVSLVASTLAYQTSRVSFYSVYIFFFQGRTRFARAKRSLRSCGKFVHT